VIAFLVHYILFASIVLSTAIIYITLNFVHCGSTNLFAPVAFKTKVRAFPMLPLQKTFFALSLNPWLYKPYFAGIVITKIFFLNLTFFWYQWGESCMRFVFLIQREVKVQNFKKI